MQTFVVDRLCSSGETLPTPHGFKKEAIKYCIRTGRSIYSQELETRLKLIDEDGNDVDKLPRHYGIGAFLNPMYGGKKLASSCKLMTETQWDHGRSLLFVGYSTFYVCTKIYSLFSLIIAEQDVLRELVDIAEAETCGDGVMDLLSDCSDSESNDEDDDDDILDNKGQSVRMAKFAAEAELGKWKKYKQRKYFPALQEDSKFYRVLQKKDGSPGIKVGPVNKNSEHENLPSGRNMAKYIDGKGHFDLLNFFTDHRRVFPLLFILVQRHLSIVSNEAGAERVFSQSAMIAHPTRANIGVKTYENIVKKKVNMSSIRVPVSAVVDEFLRRKRVGWQKSLEDEIAIVIAHEESLEMENV